MVANAESAVSGAAAVQWMVYVLRPSWTSLVALVAGASVPWQSNQNVAL